MTLQAAQSCVRVIKITSLTSYWTDHWVRIPATTTGQRDGRTHGVAVTRRGQVVLFQQADPTVLIYSPQGVLRYAWGGGRRRPAGAG